MQSPTWRILLLNTDDIAERRMLLPASSGKHGPDDDGGDGDDFTVRRRLGWIMKGW